MMNETIQSWLAILVVTCTAVVFTVRYFRKKKSGCAGGCGCASKSAQQQKTFIRPSAKGTGKP